jgi:hypothetical protein
VRITYGGFVTVATIPLRAAYDSAQAATAAHTPADQAGSAT